MSVNYCAIIQPMRIYPHEVRDLLKILETLLWPKGEIDQALMFVITTFLRNKLEEYNTQQAEEFSSMCIGTLVSSENRADLPSETHTEVTVAPDYPYPEGTAEKNRSKKKAKSKKGKK